MKIGDLVERTYGEGQRPRALIVGWYRPEVFPDVAKLMWIGSDKVVQFSTKTLEVISEGR